MLNLENLKIGLACDHAGYELKEEVKIFLKNAGCVGVVDFGCHSSESVDYPDFAHKLGAAIERKECDFGVAICGSGNGISMTLNKHRGVRAALCWEADLAALARQHNDANVLSLPARFVSSATALKLVETFFSAEFEGGRHEKRVNKINL